jgi:hypothetical protein
VDDPDVGRVVSAVRVRTVTPDDVPGLAAGLLQEVGVTLARDVG